MQNSIIDEELNQVPAIEEALDLVSTPAHTFDDWKIRGLGLTQVLLGLAQVQSLRLSRLASLVYKLEGKLIDSETIDKMDTSQLIGLYRLVNVAVEQSSEYIRGIVKETDWTKMEADLLTSSVNKNQNVPQDLQKVARELLPLLAQLQASSSQGQEG